MFTTNPFAELSATIPLAIMQGYLILMIFFVVAGTLFDVIHKGSARYFFANFKKFQLIDSRHCSAPTTNHESTPGHTFTK